MDNTLAVNTLKTAMINAAATFHGETLDSIRHLLETLPVSTKSFTRVEHLVAVTLDVEYALIFDRDANQFIKYPLQRLYEQGFKGSFGVSHLSR